MVSANNVTLTPKLNTGAFGCLLCVRCQRVRDAARNHERDGVGGRPDGRRRSMRTPSCRRRRAAAPSRWSRGRSASMATGSNCWRCTRPRTCYLTPAGTSKLIGGTDPTSIHVHMDFSALGLASVRQLWLTFAPPLDVRRRDRSTRRSWRSRRRSGRRSFPIWTVGDPGGVTPLKIAGPGSVTITSTIRGRRGRVAAGIRWRAGTWAASPGRAPCRRHGHSEVLLPVRRTTCIGARRSRRSAAR